MTILRVLFFSFSMKKRISLVILCFFTVLMFFWSLSSVFGMHDVILRSSVGNYSCCPEGHWVFSLKKVCDNHCCRKWKNIIDIIEYFTPKKQSFLQSDWLTALSFCKKTWIYEHYPCYVVCSYSQPFDMIHIKNYSYHTLIWVVKLST
jgi:hypothetical protein